MSEAHLQHPPIKGVVVGIWNDDGELLAIRRGAQVRMAPLKVCFPGGAIEQGESAEEAAKREIREELGIDVLLGRCVWQWQHPERPLRLWGYSATLANGVAIKPDPFEVHEFKWLTAIAIANHPDGLVSNAEFVAALVNDREAAGLPIH